MIKYNYLLEQIGNEAIDKIENKTIKDNLDYWSFVVNRVEEILESDRDYAVLERGTKKLYKKTFLFGYKKKISDVWDVASKVSLNQNELSIFSERKEEF